MVLWYTAKTISQISNIGTNIITSTRFLVIFKALGLLTANFKSSDFMCWDPQGLTSGTNARQLIDLMTHWDMLPKIPVCASIEPVYHTLKLKPELHDQQYILYYWSPRPKTLTGEEEDWLVRKLSSPPGSDMQTLRNSA